MGKEITNCSECAFVQKTDKGLWCPFHDQIVSKTLVCDQFIGEMETPQWVSLAAGIAGTGKQTPHFTGRDIFAYIMTAALMALGMAPLLIGIFLV